MYFNIGHLGCPILGYAVYRLYPNCGIVTAYLGLSNKELGDSSSDNCESADTHKHREYRNQSTYCGYWIDIAISNSCNGR